MGTIPSLCQNCYSKSIPLAGSTLALYWLFMELHSCAPFFCFSTIISLTRLARISVPNCWLCHSLPSWVIHGYQPSLANQPQPQPQPPPPQTIHPHRPSLPQAASASTAMLRYKAREVLTLLTGGVPGRVGGGLQDVGGGWVLVGG